MKLGNVQNNSFQFCLKKIVALLSENGKNTILKKKIGKELKLLPQI